MSRKLTPFVIDALSLSGVALAHNKVLRKELLDFRNRRDKFLRKRLHLLAPFLPEKVIIFIFIELVIVEFIVMAE